MNNLTFRKAVSHLIDKDQIVDIYMGDRQLGRLRDELRSLESVDSVLSIRPPHW